VVEWSNLLKGNSGTVSKDKKPSFTNTKEQDISWIPVAKKQEMTDCSIMRGYTVTEIS
jgi:hypothetical protein